jgi:DNA adenine methylase
MGKRQLLDVLKATAPENFDRYYEPFVGGGAFLFSQLPRKAVISDSNPELINCYKIIRDEVDALINCLHTYKNDERYFYAMRGQLPAQLSPVQRASRFIYLNKICFKFWTRKTCGQSAIICWPPM